jgi:transposase
MDSLYLSKSKKKADQEKAIIVYEDEASFRQSPTLHQTWAYRNSQPQIPTRGQRNTQKILGGVRLDNGRFVYRHQTEYFNVENYLDFLEQRLMPFFYKRNHRVYLIQDNASYHKAPEVYEWFNDNRKRLEVFLLPKYSPELNATERLWWYTRKCATHNRYFDKPDDLCHALFFTFREIQQNPDNILGLLKPFF